MNKIQVKRCTTLEPCLLVTVLCVKFSKTPLPRLLRERRHATLVCSCCHQHSIWQVPPACQMLNCESHVASSNAVWQSVIAVCRCQALGMPASQYHLHGYWHSLLLRQGVNQGLNVFFILLVFFCQNKEELIRYWSRSASWSRSRNIISSLSI